MDTNDLFSFLEGTPAESDDADEEMVVDALAFPLPQKRQIDDPISASISSKKVKTEEPVEPAAAPVVLDDFETEAKREIVASAGFAGGAEPGSRLEIRHQVCLSLKRNVILTLLGRFGIKLWYLQDIITFQSRNTSLLRNLIVNTSLNSIHSKKYPFMPSKGTRAC